MKRKVLLSLLLTFLLAVNVNAATMLEIKSQDGLSYIYSEGTKGRMEMAGAGEYMLIDTKKNTLFVVMPSKQMVLDMSESLGEPDLKEGGQSGSARLEKAGSGPKIVGYKTTRYDLKAGKRHCGSVFASKAALKDSNMRHILGFLQGTAARAKGFNLHQDMEPDDCVDMDEQLIDKIDELGLPMRALDEKGAVESEVTKIQKNAQLPPNPFAFPKTYQVKTMSDIHKETQRQMQQQMPQMEEMMRQMQDSGQLTPEALEELKRAREMMKQYQQ